jgi:DNA-binding GntR family transcriptional regulator
MRRFFRYGINISLDKGFSFIEDQIIEDIIRVVKPHDKRNLYMRIYLYIINQVKLYSNSNVYYSESQTDIAEKCGAARATVSKAIAELLNNKILILRRSGNNLIKKNSAYDLNPLYFL